MVATTVAIIVFRNEAAVTIAIILENPLVPGRFSAFARINLFCRSSCIEALNAVVNGTRHIPTN